MLLTACAPAAPPDATRTVSDSLRGTWRVARFPAFPGSDTVRYPFGAVPVGYLVYDETGHVFWQILGTSAMDSLETGVQRGAPDSVLLRLSRGFRAQFGTYTIQAGDRTVTHRYEGENIPYRGSFEVATPFELKADSLFIGADSLMRWRFVRVR